MKKKTIPFNAEDPIGSVEAVRDSVAGRRKVTLRTTRLILPEPAPVVTPNKLKSSACD